MNHATPQSVLRTVFGYETFRPLQLEVIQHVLSSKDALVIMPTGGGKSLCYQIPALLFDGLTVVVSPLISLMKDQVEQLREVGVEALFLNSSLSLEEYRRNVNQIQAGKTKIVYVAPETLLTDRFLSILNSVKIALLAIDEAHCISEWGHDFRPEYREIAAVRERFPSAVTIALTATATPRVRADIRKSLRMDTSGEFLASFNRENLLIEVVPKTKGVAQVLAFLKRYPKQAGIIYCFSRKGVDDLALELAANGYSARPYHAGLDDETRRKNQEAFIRDDIQIIVATIAFGMGINKPNVRFVIHFDLPKSIEGYYQEIGRAGRDGLNAHCLLLYAFGDVQKQRYFIHQKTGMERQVATHQLSEMLHFAEASTCRRVPLMKYFGEKFTQDNCGMCDHCLGGALDEVVVTVPAQKFLSCVWRTGESFDAEHIIDVLLGSENTEVLALGHQTLSTYGIGKDLSRDWWKSLYQGLLKKGYLEEYGVEKSLRLTPEAVQALKNREAISCVMAGDGEPALKAVLAGRLAGEEYDRDLFEILRSKRKELADEHGLPPYVIFSDRTLTDMATWYPMQNESMAKMYGVGAVKMERYGEIFLELIRAYCEHRGFSERQPEKSAGRGEKKSSRAAATARPVAVGNAYNAGSTVKMLMEQYEVKLNTILENLTTYITSGYSLRSGDDVRALSQLSYATQDAVLRAFREVGHEKLRPVFERMGERVSYDELKILRLVHLINSQAGQE